MGFFSSPPPPRPGSKPRAVLSLWDEKNTGVPHLSSFVSSKLYSRQVQPRGPGLPSQTWKAQNNDPVCSRSSSTLGKTSTEDQGLTLSLWPLTEWECHLRKRDSPSPVLCWARGFCPREKASNLTEELQGSAWGGWTLFGAESREYLA